MENSLQDKEMQRHSGKMLIGHIYGKGPILLNLVYCEEMALNYVMQKQPQSPEI